VSLTSFERRDNPFRDNHISLVKRYLEEMKTEKLPIEIPVWTSMIKGNTTALLLHVPTRWAHIPFVCS
jgi:hypothetical protein